jgi:hypothetical protein
VTAGDDDHAQDQRQNACDRRNKFAILHSSNPRARLPETESRDFFASLARISYSAGRNAFAFDARRDPLWPDPAEAG